jgi:hypothetical protein
LLLLNCQQLVTCSLLLPLVLLPLLLLQLRRSGG